MKTHIFNNFSEVKEYIGANANNELATIEPYINHAAIEFLIPLISKQEWEEILTDYPDQLSTEHQNLIPYIRNVLANFAYYLFADDATINLTDYGLIRLEDQQSKSAYQWQVRIFKERRWLNGWQAIENLAQFLYQNMQDYPTWFDSHERILWNDLLVWNTTQFRQFYRINSLGTLFNLHPHIKEVHSTIIEPLITTELYQSILNNIHDGNITGDNADLLPYLQRVVVFGTLKDIIKNIGYEIGKSGLQISTIESNTQNSEKTTNTVAYNREIMHKEITQKFQSSLNRLINYLNATATSNKYIPYYTKYINITPPTATDHNEEKKVKFFGI